MHASPATGIPESRRGSGTSWLPSAMPMRAPSTMWSGWMLSAHGAVFAQYDDQFTKRGDQQLGIVDWEMLMAMRPVGAGRLDVRLMTSMEPFVLGGSGYPLLLQTGGTYQHAVIHDRQHPHSALVEVATQYEYPATSAATFSLYAAAVGEPAVGPVAFMHRPSAQNDPMAPLGHHWQDASHQSFGVLTAGVNTRTLKLEVSAFNPREADENHLVVDYRDAKLDSYAGRVSWAPSSRFVGSTWWSYHETHARLDPTARMHRYGASVMTDAQAIDGGHWATTVIWGMNLHHHGGASHALIHGAPGASPHHHSSSLLVESNFEVGDAAAIFARAERVQKNGEELGFLGGDLTELYDVRSVAAGFTRRIASKGSAELALGLRASVNIVPQTLNATYGTRTPAGFAIYAQLRPRRGGHGPVAE